MRPPVFGPRPRSTPGARLPTGAPLYVLEVIEGPDRGKRFELPAHEPQLLGRSTEAIPLSDPSISRRHAELTPRNGRWWVRDLRSSNGTWVNGAPVLDEVALDPGDRLRCGDSTLRLVAPQGRVQLPTGGSPPAEDGRDFPLRLAAIGETMATLSHSIKNILQGLRGGADAVELALQKGDLERAREGWPILARNLDRILALTLNMLAYSRERPLDLEPTQPNDVLREVAELLAAPARRRRVDLRLELDPAMPPVPLDVSAVHQVVVNLALNALEAAADRTGRVVLRTRFAAPAPPAQTACVIEVEDNGPGISPAQQARLFEPFATTKGQRGTGLGLAVSRKLVQQMGGEIRHVAPPEGGTSMVVTLPAGGAQEDADRTSAPKPLPGGDIGIDFE